MDPTKQKKWIELKVAVFIVWIIISIITTTIILFPFFADKKTVLENTPTCISKSQFNVDCSLCGITRAFIEISNGNFRNAFNLNNGSLFVYLSFIFNSSIFIAYCIYSININNNIKSNI